MYPAYKTSFNFPLFINFTILQKSESWEKSNLDITLKYLIEIFFFSEFLKANKANKNPLKTENL